jgi:nucleoside-diphosphate-sugar epimerase
LIFDSNTEGFSCEKIKADIRNYEAVANAVEGSDAVFHFAAMSRVVWGQQDPQNCWFTNTMGTVNVSNVYGSERDQLKRVIPKFMIQALKGEAITLYGGDQILDFTFIDDTVLGILAAYTAAIEGSKSIIGQDFHFVTGRGVSVSELSEMIVKVANSKSKIERIEAKDFDVTKFIGDPAKSSRILKFKAKVKLEDGLKRLKDRIQARLNTPELNDRMEKAL